MPKDLQELLRAQAIFTGNFKEISTSASLSADLAGNAFHCVSAAGMVFVKSDSMPHCQFAILPRRLGSPTKVAWGARVLAGLEMFDERSQSSGLGVADIGLQSDRS